MQRGALVLEGGSLRCLFTCGILDTLMEQDIWFEYVNGVSAGSLSGYNYISRQPRRTRDINEKYCAAPRYLGFRNMVHNGGVFNFGFLFGEICDTLNPLDRKTFVESQQKFEVVATDCLTGKAAFFNKDRMPLPEFETACRASSSMPGLADIVEVQGVPYLDGGCACPVAFQRALDLGYDKVVVVLTRPRGFRKPPQPKTGSASLWRGLYGRYPAFCHTLEEMHRNYNSFYAQIEELERQGRVFVLCPEGPVLVGRLERDSSRLEALYQSGKYVMQARMEAMRQYLES